MNLKLLLDFNPPTTTIIFTTTTPPYSYAHKILFCFLESKRERKWKSFVVIMPAFCGWETAASSAMLRQDDEDIHFIIKFYSSSFSRCSLNEIIPTFRAKTRVFLICFNDSMHIPFKTIPFLHRAEIFHFMYVKSFLTKLFFFFTIRVKLILFPHVWHLHDGFWLYLWNSQEKKACCLASKYHQ